MVINPIINISSNRNIKLMPGLYFNYYWVTNPFSTERKRELLGWLEKTKDVKEMLAICW